MSHLNYRGPVTYNSANEKLKEAMQSLDSYQQHSATTHKSIKILAAEAERLQKQYYDVQVEKQALYEQRLRVEEQIAKIRSLAGTYAAKDAVVASDGYTYEHETISEYIRSCQAQGSTPHSQQTDEPISSLLVPNRSLKGFTERVLEIINRKKAPQPSTGGGRGGGGPRGGRGGAGYGGGAGPHAGAEMGQGGEATIEVNDKGERLHPCTRVYGFCNYGENCTYAGYPYGACLSHLKGKCRFGNQCHEDHVEFRGPLTRQGEPNPAAAAGTPPGDKTAKDGSHAKAKDKKGGATEQKKAESATEEGTAAEETAEASGEKN